MRASAPKQAGFTLATGVFLLVVMAALGAFVLTISTLQHAGATYDVEGARASQAARAGIEWGSFQALRSASCAGSSSFSPGGSAANFTVTVQCSSSTADELGTTVTVYALTSTACNQPSAGVCPNSAPGDGYVERQSRASLATP